MTQEVNTNLRHYYHVADKIYKRYTDFYGIGTMPAISLILAEDLHKQFKLQVRTGVLHTADGDIQHYWVVYNGKPIDPVFKAILTRDDSAYLEPEAIDGWKSLCKISKRYDIYKL